jgi:hypothetical protein
MGEHDLLSASFLIETAQYYIFVVIPAYRLAGKFQWMPVLGPKPAFISYHLMRIYNRRFKKIVLARYARNRRLGDALQQWAFCSLRGSPGAKAYYHQLRDRKIGHEAALRQLANRFVGILHGCLKTHTTYNENTAWAHHVTIAA